MKKKFLRPAICIIMVFLFVLSFLYSLAYFINIRKIETALQSITCNTDCDTVFSNLKNCNDVELYAYGGGYQDVNLLKDDISNVDFKNVKYYVLYVHGGDNYTVFVDDDIETAETTFSVEQPFGGVLPLFRKDVSTDRHKLQYSYGIEPDIQHLLLYRHCVLQVDNYVFTCMTTSLATGKNVEKLIARIGNTGECLCID